MHEKPKRKSILLVLAVALIINAAALWLVPPHLPSFGVQPYSLEFVDLYDLIGKNVANGDGYRIDAQMAKTMVREPGYPLFLAILFKIAGYHIEAVRLGNLALVIGIVFMLFRLTMRLTGDSAIALYATLLFLLYPGTLICEARGGVEIAFIFCLMLFMLAVHDAVEKRNAWRYFFAGLLLGGAVMVRSTAMAFPIFLLAYLIARTAGTPERLRVVLRVGALVLGMVIVMAPWIIRNYFLVHEFVPTASVQGVAAQEGQYTCEMSSTGKNFYELQREAGKERNELATQLGLPFKDTYFQVFYVSRDEIAFNKALLKATSKEYFKEPELFAACVGKNLFFNFWFLGKTWTVTKLNLLVQLPILILSAGGVYVAWKDRHLKKMGIILIFLAYVPLIHAPIIAHARHSLVIFPFLALFISLLLVSISRALFFSNTQA
jgi:4-amino-4-deoxy-L-arabinose transferase-like glycosyltransferase